MLDLKQSRQKIDEIDEKIVELFEQRMDISKEVAEYKISTGKRVLDKERECQKMDALERLVTNKYNSYPVKELFTQIMSMSRKYQYSLIPSYSAELSLSCAPSLSVTPETKVMCFGEPGSYSEQAMEDFFGTEIQCLHGNTFKSVMEAVQQREADFGVLPIENTSTGGILDTYDLLLQYNNYIIGEHILKIHHALIGLPGTAMDDLKTVFSHPQGILQCREFLNAHPGIRPVEYLSTSAAAKKVLEEGDRSQGAIASERAAKYYHLTVLQKQLNTESSNSTRFIIITNQKLYLQNANKVSLCFELPHESGTLYNMLSHFIYNNLSMTKIESRPIMGRPWEYRFFVDFEGNLKDAGVRNAINGIKEESARLRILGNILTR